jgi:hypothetical protein
VARLQAVDVDAEPFGRQWCTLTTRSLLNIRMKSIIRWLIACARPTSRMYRRDAVMRGLRGKLKVGRRVSR